MSTTSKLNKALWLALFVPAIGLSGAVAAQEESSEDSADDNKIRVVGSRIKRTEVEGASPIIVITNEDMKARGHVTVFDALTNLTLNQGFQFEGPESAAFTPDVQTLNLRGFGVGNTLMLLNGRRVANYPAAYQSDTSVANFGAIPAAAVERIEILSTGASAIYGSDAVAGVVNIILRKDIDETTVNVLWGTPTETKSNRESLRVQAVTGKYFDKGSFTATFEYQDRDSLTGGDYDDFDSNLDYPYGVGVLDRAVLDLDWWAANGWALDTASDGYNDPGVGTCEALNNDTVRAFRPNRGYFCGRDGAKDINFRNARESFSVYLNGNYQLTDDLEAFTDILYYSSESASNNGRLFVSENIYDFSTSRDTIFGTFWDWYLAQRFFSEEELGRDLDEQFEDDALSVAVGLKGYWGTNDWEVVFNNSEYEYTSSRPWFKAESVIDLFLGDSYGFDFFGDPVWAGNGSIGIDRNSLFQPYTADQIAQINNAIGEQTYGNETTSRSLQFTMTGDFFDLDLGAGTLQYAMVAEYEDQELEFIPDARIQQDPPLEGLSGSGWWGLTGYSGKGDRQRSAIGLEVDIPLHDTFLVNVAARVDRYDDDSSSIGTRTTPQVKFEWRPFDSLLVRGGYTESFRAPDLVVQSTETGFFTSATDLVTCAQNGQDPEDCDSSSVFARRVPAGQGAGEPLKDETGHTAWFGFSAELAENLTLMVDWNEIELEDKVQLESLQGLLDDEFECYEGRLTGARCDYVASRIQREVDPLTGIATVRSFNASPINVAEERVESIDARLLYTIDTDYGRFGFNTEYSHVLEHTFKNSSDSEELDLRDDPINGGWDFRSKLTAQLSYSYGDFFSSVTAFRRGSTTVFRPSQLEEGESSRVGKYLTYNVTAGYQWTDNFMTRLTVNNVFDKEPPKDDTHFFYDYPWYNIYVYSGAGIGREAFVELQYTF